MSSGRPQCDCDSGYDSGCGDSGCYDINECDSQIDECDTNAICINTYGSYICECKDDYVSDGRSCIEKFQTHGMIELNQVANHVHDHVWVVNPACERVRIFGSVDAVSAHLLFAYTDLPHSTLYSFQINWNGPWPSWKSGPPPPPGSPRTYPFDNVISGDLHNRLFNSFTVRLQSGAGILGFVLNWSCVAQEGTSGTIEHEDYGNYQNRAWIINSDCDKVRIQSSHFDTERRYDTVAIGDQIYSGYLMDSIDQVVDQSVTVYFSSDNKITRPGFVLNWACDVARGTSGIIQLNDYGNDHDRIWMVDSECNRVRIVSTYFDTQHVYDYLTIDDHGDSETSDAEYSGDDQLNTGTVEIDQIVGPSFTVRFKSNTAVTHTGFSLFWSCLEAASTSQWNGWTEWTACTAVCGSNQYGTSERHRQCCADMEDSGIYNYCIGRCDDCKFHCNGNHTESRSCDPTECQIANWASWEEWADCSASCGTGYRERVRDCSTSAGVVTAKACDGLPFERITCDNYHCGKSFLDLSGFLYIISSRGIFCHSVSSGSKLSLRSSLVLNTVPTTRSLNTTKLEYSPDRYLFLTI